MILFIITIAWFLFLVHFLWRIGKIYFSRENLDHSEDQGTNDWPFVTVIIPARNEEANIEKCVRSLASQTYPSNQLQIVVVDDNSSDPTASIVKELMTDYENISLMPAGELPGGWAGKNHACWQGVKNAQGDWLCFMDADTVSHPDLLINAIRFSEAKHIDLLSINPFQEISSCAERFFLPGVFLAIASTMKFNSVNDPSKPDSGANGQFMLFKKSVYKALDGHRTVKSNVMEDMALADLVKKSGFRLYWVFGEKLIRTRMYTGFSHIWEGLSKNMVDIMKDSGKILPIYRSVSSFILGWMPMVMPVIAFVDLNQTGVTFPGLWALVISIAASISFLIFYLLSLRAMNAPLRYVLSFPFGFTLHAALTINSMRKIIQGKREWKGRVYS